MSQDELTRPDPEEERPDDTAAAQDTAQDTAAQSDALQSDVSRSDASAAGEDDPFAAFAEVQRPEERRKAKIKKSDKKPNKRLRTLLFAAGAVVLLIAILLLVLFLPQGGDDPNSSETPSSDVSSYTVYDKAPKKDDTDSSNSSDTDDTDVVQKIEVKNTHGTYTLIRKDKALVLDGYTDLTLNDTAVSGVADAATKLKATDSLGKATDLAQFGLSTPVATMTVTYTDGSTLTLYLGNATPSESGYYVRLSDSDEVFICSSSTVSDLFEANTGRDLADHRAHRQIGRQKRQGDPLRGRSDREELSAAAVAAAHDGGRSEGVYVLLLSDHEAVSARYERCGNDGAVVVHLPACRQRGGAAPDQGAAGGAGLQRSVDPRQAGAGDREHRIGRNVRYGGLRLVRYRKQNTSDLL